jgi:hypothetical protein
LLLHLGTRGQGAAFGGNKIFLPRRRLNTSAIESPEPDKSKGMFLMKKEEIKTFVQGALVGGIVLAIGIFWSGMAVTSGSAEEMARDQTRDAIVAQLAPICAAQFSLTADPQKMRKDMEAIDSWNRAGFIKTNGWATMPGSESPRDDIAGACAVLIMEMDA